MNKIVLILLLTAAAAMAQNREAADSLYHHFLAAHSGPQEGRMRVTAPHQHGEKCGLPLISAVRENMQYYTSAQKAAIEQVLARPELQTSIVSPSGRFRVHYDLDGTNAPVYDPQVVAEALDDSYNFIVGTLGFDPPPIDNGAGGGDEYDIYIQELYSYYGETITEGLVSAEDSTYYTYTRMDNDFKNFYTSGEPAAQVTAAHEFFHMIQLGSYINRYSIETWFYEINSVAMEEFMYPEVNDYIGYMRNYFRNPARSFIETSGYDVGLWNIFIRDAFSYDVIKHQWELMRDHTRAIPAINASLQNVGSSFRNALNLFGIWTNFTGYRAIPGQYFDDAAGYPIMSVLRNTPFNAANGSSVTLQTKPLSNNILQFHNASRGDTIVAVLTNGDLDNGLGNVNSLMSVTYGLYNREETGAAQISDYYYSSFEPENPVMWSMAELLNGEIADRGTASTFIDYPYPSPFVYGRGALEQINIPVEKQEGTSISMKVYTAAMDQVYEASLPYSNPVRWRVAAEDGGRLASGVYIYVLEIDGDIEKGKLVIVNE